MNDPNLANFEAQLERLIEGAFAHLFSKTVRAQDIALRLARAMATEAASTAAHDRPTAPDHYVITLNADVHTQLLANRPDLAQILSRHMIDLATSTGYRLDNDPLITLLADATLPASGLKVAAAHSDATDNSTAAMQRAELPRPELAAVQPPGSQLIINGEQTVPLHDAVINIGRSRENQIVLDDPYVSRQHAQMRLRFGRYVLFDIQSQTGTFVNETRTQQHQLQSGDVIQLGRTRLVYLEDHTDTSDTRPLPPDRSPEPPS